jgi:hypothetical protein
MGGALEKVALSIAMTHGVRVLGRLLGPRRGALVLGLPSSTALVLVCCGLERGLDDAAGMAEASLLGLAAACALPLVFARALSAGWRLPWAPLAAVGGYLTLAAALRGLPALGLPGGGIVALTAVLTACRWAPRIAMPDEPRSARGPTRCRAMVVRTVVPAVCVMLIMAIRDAAGTRWAGLLSTFPGLSLALLVVAHIESGPALACQLALALPPGNLGMIAFLTLFRLGCPRLGLAGATACGYLGAMAAILAVDGTLHRGGGPRRVQLAWSRIVAGWTRSRRAQGQSRGLTAERSAGLPTARRGAGGARTPAAPASPRGSSGVHPPAGPLGEIGRLAAWSGPHRRSAAAPRGPRPNGGAGSFWPTDGPQRPILLITGRLGLPPAPGGAPSPSEVPAPLPGPRATIDPLRPVCSRGPAARPRAAAPTPDGDRIRPAAFASGNPSSLCGSPPIALPIYCPSTIVRVTPSCTR